MLKLLIWLFAALACSSHMLSTKLAVRLAGKGADNAWDNALGYLVVSTVLYWPAKWAWGTGSWLLLGALPLVAAFVHLIALEAIYQVKTKRALLIGSVQLVFATAFITGCGLLVGAAAAYLEYHRIIADPRILLRIVLRLIGIEPPF